VELWGLDLSEGGEGIGWEEGPRGFDIAWQSRRSRDHCGWHSGRPLPALRVLQSPEKYGRVGHAVARAEIYFLIEEGNQRFHFRNLVVVEDYAPIPDLLFPITLDVVHGVFAGSLDLVSVDVENPGQVGNPCSWVLLFS